MMFFPITWLAWAAPLYPVPGADGLYHLSYELKLGNNFGGALVIDSVEVLDAQPVNADGVAGLVNRLWPRIRVSQ